MATQSQQEWAARELQRRKMEATTVKEKIALQQDILRAQRDPAYLEELARIGEKGKWQSGLPMAAQYGLGGLALASAFPALGIPAAVGTAAGLGLAAMGVPSGLEALSRRRAGMPWGVQALTSAADVALPGIGKAVGAVRAAGGAKRAAAEAAKAAKPQRVLRYDPKIHGTEADKAKAWTASRDDIAKERPFKADPNWKPETELEKSVAGPLTRKLDKYPSIQRPFDRGHGRWVDPQPDDVIRRDASLGNLTPGSESYPQINPLLRELPGSPSWFGAKGSLRPRGVHGKANVVPTRRFRSRKGAQPVETLDEYTEALARKTQQYQSAGMSPSAAARRARSELVDPRTISKTRTPLTKAQSEHSARQYAQRISEIEKYTPTSLEQLGKLNALRKSVNLPPLTQDEWIRRSLRIPKPPSAASGATAASGVDDVSGTLPLGRGSPVTPQTPPTSTPSGQFYQASPTRSLLSDQTKDAGEEIADDAAKVLTNRTYGSRGTPSKTPTDTPPTTPTVEKLTVDTPTVDTPTVFKIEGPIAKTTVGKAFDDVINTDKWKELIREQKDIPKGKRPAVSRHMQQAAAKAILKEMNQYVDDYAKVSPGPEGQKEFIKLIAGGRPGASKISKKRIESLAGSVIGPTKGGGQFSAGRAGRDVLNATISRFSPAEKTAVENRLSEMFTKIMNDPKASDTAKKNVWKIARPDTSGPNKWIIHKGKAYEEGIPRGKHVASGQPNMESLRLRALLGVSERSKVYGKILTQLVTKTGDRTMEKALSNMEGSFTQAFNNIIHGKAYDQKQTDAIIKAITSANIELSALIAMIGGSQIMTQGTPPDATNR